MKYEIIAIDVDGTLVGPDQKVPAEAAAALADAARAGLRVVLATGRSRVETMPVWRQLHLPTPYEPLILIGGALVSEPDAGRTLYHRPIPRELAWEYADALNGAGYSAAAIIDPWRHGLEYYFAESSDADYVWRRWFSRMDVKIRRVRRLSDAGDMPDPLRINAVVEPSDAEQLAAAMRERFGGRLEIHWILAPNYGATVVEAFAAGVNKWTALRYVAQAYRVGPGRIVAAGDDVNDLAMVRAAGLGVAFPHSPPELRAAARHVAEEGLAKFIRELMAGRFG